VHRFAAEFQQLANFMSTETLFVVLEEKERNQCYVFCTLFYSTRGSG